MFLIFLPVNLPVDNRARLLVRLHNIRLRNVEIGLHHQQRTVAQYPLEREDIPAVPQKIDCERMPEPVTVNLWD